MQMRSRSRAMAVVVSLLAAWQAFEGRAASPSQPRQTIEESRWRFIREDTETIEVEETLALKTKRTFRIKGFTKTPERDFLLVVAKDGLTLTQDQELGLERLKDIPLDEQEKYLEGMRSARRELDQRGMLIINSTGHDVHVKAYVDGRLALEESVPGKNPPGWIPTDRPHWQNHPRLWSVIVLSPLAKELVVEEGLFLRKTATLELRSFLRGPGALVVVVSAGGLSLETRRVVRP